mgnify:FL=1|jgi:hypothetical protein
MSRRGVSKVQIMAGLLAALALNPAAARIICWTDDHGRKACGDVAPPEVSTRERQVINARGMVVEVQPRAPTEAERQAKAEATLRAAEEAAMAERAAAYDRFLLETYRDLDELVLQGERRIEAVMGRKALAERAVADTETAVADLRTRRDALLAEDRPIPARLAEQLQTFNNDLTEHQAALDGITRQERTLRERYANDAARFAALKAGTP